ncbi:MAG: hypothetical protein HY072_00495, partial [Deltaproteobacteria bacterium]|nr:hypothetical protein [Deltaproteobacteria bacterium]
MGGAEQTTTSNKIYVGVIPMSDEVLFTGVTLSLHVIEKKQDEMLKKIALEDL